jgi:pyruvate dehydrogenase E1 component alpha subunit
VKDELLINLYKKLFLCRSAENPIIKHYNEDEMKTPMHMSLGEEAIIAGVVEAIKPDGQAMGTFRSHAVYLCMTEETDNFFLELYGKKNDIANGKSGSMHLSCREKGLMCSSAIVSSSIPVACGLAFANKMQNNNKVVACFFGDGATEGGVFWESVNIACLYKLPILFVCEDNGLAVHSPLELRKGYNYLPKIISEFNCRVLDTGESTDVLKIYETAKEAVSHILSYQEPVFLYSRYYRYMEHVGINEDFNAGYRNRDEFEKWFLRDPVNIARLKIDASVASIIENEIDEKVAKSIQQAKQAVFPDANELWKGVYANE